MPGDRAVADILWKAVEMAGVPRCGYPLLAQNGKNSGNSIDKSEYLSYNLYMEQFRRECGTRAPARSCRRNHGLVLVPVHLVWCRR